MLENVIYTVTALKLYRKQNVSMCHLVLDVLTVANIQHHICWDEKKGGL